MVAGNELVSEERLLNGSGRRTEVLTALPSDVSSGPCSRTQSGATGPRRFRPRIAGFHQTKQLGSDSQRSRASVAPSVRLTTCGHQPPANVLLNVGGHLHERLNDIGALSFEAKTALARGATMAGSATCSGEGGMIPDERRYSTKWYYQCIGGY